MKKKIFIADPSESLLHQLSSFPKAIDYEWMVMTTGEGAFEAIKNFEPNLVLLDFFLPQIHGIAILQELEIDPTLKHCGVIIAADYPVMQNDKIAILSGANYFLRKPFTPEQFFDLVERFFEGRLHPQPSQRRVRPKKQKTQMPPPSHSSYIRFWGTRGSYPVSGKEFIRYGGNTSCLEVSMHGETIIFDAGTGIATLGEHMQAQEKKLHLFLSHTHIDHIIGLPFFAPLHCQTNEIHIWTPIGFEQSQAEPFSTLFSYPYFPVSLDDLQTKINFHTILEGTSIKVNGFEIESHYAFHPGITLCFKIKAGGKTFGFITDHEFLMGNTKSPKEIITNDPMMKPYQSFIEFFKGCDFLIHEAQYFPEEYESKEGWGHSSLTNATIFLRETGIKEWIVTHHDPSHTDMILQRKLELQQQLLKESQIDCNIIFAYDGLLYPI